MYRFLGGYPDCRNRLYSDAAVFHISGYALSILYALLIVVPVLFVGLSAFKDNASIFAKPLGLPQQLRFTKFILAQQNVNLLRAIAVSFLVTTGAEALTLLLAFPAAYGIARLRIRLASFAEALFALGFLIPPLAILMPIYLMTARAGMVNNPLALIVFYPALRLPISVILLASYLRKLLVELEASAQIDGASVLQTIPLIFFPLSAPAVVTVVILNFIDIWNEYLFALILMSSDNRTVQVAVSLLKNQRSIDYGLIAAGVVTSLVPVYTVFLVFQERIMQGMLRGALKE